MFHIISCTAGVKVAWWPFHQESVSELGGCRKDKMHVWWVAVGDCLAEISTLTWFSALTLWHNGVKPPQTCTSYTQRLILEHEKRIKEAASWRTFTCSRHPFNGLFLRTTWVSWHWKSSSSLDFNEARDDGWHWHQLDHMQIVCTSLQTDNHVSTSSVIFYRLLQCFYTVGWASGRVSILFLTPNQQCKTTEAAVNGH